MKKIALVIALLFTLFFGSLLIWDNIIGLSFSWEDLLLYIIVGSIIYFIIKFVGQSLDKTFNKFIQSFIDGEQESLIINKRLLRTFGLLLITLFPFLIYLLFLALFAAIDFGLYGYLFISQMDLIPTVVLLGLGIVILGTLFAVLSGFYYIFFPPQDEAIGVVVNKAEQPKLWEFINQVADKIGVQRIDKIIISPSTTVGVYLDGNLIQNILGKSEKTLVIGFFSLLKINISEFEAVLAHEFGHFSNRDTSWSTYTYVMGNSLLSTLQKVPGPHVNPVNSSLVGLIIYLNPAYWLLLVYVKLYFKITNGFSRIREVMADTNAINIFGGKAFRDGLLKIAINDKVYSELLNIEYIPEVLEKKRETKNLQSLFEDSFNKINEVKFEEIKNDIINNSQNHKIYDSHPSLKTRFDYSLKFNDKNIENTEFVTNLFNNQETLTSNISNIYNQKLLNLAEKIKEINKSLQPAPELSKEEKKLKRKNENKIFWRKLFKIVGISFSVFIIGLLVLAFILS